MSKATETAVKLLESLPEGAQEHVVESLRQMVQDAQDEARWDELFNTKKKGLLGAARKARKEIIAGKAVDMDYDRL